MNGNPIYLGLDVGTQRIGLAYGDTVGRIAQPLRTIMVDGTEGHTIRHAIGEFGVDELVVGRPRNQAGEPTGQTAEVEAFVRKTLQPMGLPIHWQDESVTSVMAEDRLKARKKPYTKGDIDAEAACIILQDYLDRL